MPDAAELMVRDALGLKEALTHLGVALTTQECQNVLRRKSFQALLRTTKTRFQAEVANTPGRNKTSAIGQLQILADQLQRDGEFDKAAEVLFKLCKLENWVGEGQTVNVFGGLTQKDLDEMRAKLKEQEGTTVATVN